MAGIDKSVGAYDQADRQGEWGDCEADLELMARSVGVMVDGDSVGGGSGRQQASVTANVAVAEPGSSVAGSHVDQVLAGMQGEWQECGGVAVNMMWHQHKHTHMILDIEFIMQEPLPGVGSYATTGLAVNIPSKYKGLLKVDGMAPLWMVEFIAVDTVKNMCKDGEIIPNVPLQLYDFKRGRLEDMQAATMESGVVEFTCRSRVAMEWVQRTGGLALPDGKTSL